MFIIGLLAFFQTVFIPGFIFLKWAKLGFCKEIEEGTDNTIRDFVYAFALSLLINYLLVFSFTLLGIYQPFTLYIVFFIESIMLSYLLKKTYPSDFYLYLDIKKSVVNFKNFFNSRSVAYNLLFIVALGFILLHVFYFFYFIGSVFMHWDPALSWNRFALEWADNQLPSNTWRYPQLIPTNWSISYVLMQNTDVQCFAKAIMPIFSIAILLLFMDLGLRKRNAVYFFASILYGTVLGYVYDPSYIVSGYVDIAVSFFAFLSFYVIQNQYREDNNRYFKRLLLAVIFASTAAVIKQSGLFILMVILVWVCQSLIKKRKIISLKKGISIILLILLTVSVVTASWYMLKEIQIKQGKDRSEISMVQKVHLQSNLIKRFSNGVNRVFKKRNPKLKFIIYISVFLMFFGLFHKKGWGVTLFISIPYILIWGFFFSYDSRNLAPAIPFIAYSAIFGFDFIKQRLPDLEKLDVYKTPVLPVIVLGLTLLLIVNVTIFNRETLIQHQIYKKKKIGDAVLNDLLYQYHEKEGITGKIATNYLYLKYLPGLEQFYWNKWGRITLRFLEYLDRLEGKEIHYLLMPVILKSEKQVYKRFQEMIRENKYKLIFKHRGYHFIRVKKTVDER